MMRTLIAAAAALLMTATPAFAAGTPTYGSARINYKVLPSVKAQIIPNYMSGFGPQGGTGSGSNPAPGPAAVLNGGTVDFGNVVVGFQYLYKYAAQVNVQTNDSAGFVVYAEGATDLNGSNPVPTPATFPLAQTLFWLVNNSGNTPFSPAASFNRTLGTPIGANGLNGIDYSGTGGVPSAGSAVWSSPTSGNLSQGFDYQLRLSGSTPISQFDVYIVYTVVGN
ncbi:MAG: hypothetical protein JWN27_812 [Candidatus Eremiobacteraeota bacterium]|nr:hypothetical protein [Candidatus Eremiobacteraeota bacterium]